MTTYYKGNNIGLNYDAAAGSWSLTNTPKDFIDPNAFSTPDPVFPTAPTTPTTPTTPTEPEEDPCPAGYVYDTALKQCVPDPNYQNPFRQDNQGGGQDDRDNLGGTNRPIPTIREYVGGTGDDISGTGASALIPRVDTDGLGNIVEGGSGIDYNQLFNYSTTGATRAQMNEHMLILDGLSKGWIAYDDENNTYRKVNFDEQKKSNLTGLIPGWAMQFMQASNYKSYKDYFEVLDKGYQPSSKDNIWKQWLQGNSVYSLKGGMLSESPTTRGGKGNTITTINYSQDRYDKDGKFIKGFQTKIQEAMAIKDDEGNVKGIIDRDGNVNINADGKGGYYREDGKFVGSNGQVYASGTMTAGLNYIANLAGSGLKIPATLKAKLAKALDSQYVDFSKVNKTGFTIADLRTMLRDYKQEKTQQTDKELLPDPELEKTVTDVAKGISTEGDKISDDGRGIITDSSGDTYTPTSDGQGYTFKSDDPKPSVQQPISKGSTQTYGAGRGGTASQQQEMKKQDTRSPSPGSSGPPGRNYSTKSKNTFKGK